jgi:hypothetical protein
VRLKFEGETFRVDARVTLRPSLADPPDGVQELSWTDHKGRRIVALEAWIVPDQCDTRVHLRWDPRRRIVERAWIPVEDGGTPTLGGLQAAYGAWERYRALRREGRRPLYGSRDAFLQDMHAAIRSLRGRVVGADLLMSQMRCRRSAFFDCCREFKVDWRDEVLRLDGALKKRGAR